MVEQLKNKLGDLDFVPCGACELQFVDDLSDEDIIEFRPLWGV